MTSFQYTFIAKNLVFGAGAGERAPRLHATPQRSSQTKALIKTAISHLRWPPSCLLMVFARPPPPRSDGKAKSVEAAHVQMLRSAWLELADTLIGRDLAERSFFGFAVLHAFF